MATDLACVTRTLSVALARGTMLLAFAVLVAACAPAPQRAGIPTVWTPSPNFNERRPNHVILHHTGSRNASSALRTLTLARSEVSAHYLIGRDGLIFQLVDERARSWHAGASYWGGHTDLNSSSIGIELDNNGDEPFAEPQITALLALLGDLGTRLKIPPANILGHGDVSPGRKVDPSRHFPWRVLAERGFGVWCDPPHSPAPELDPILALQALGYSVADPEAAARAFKRRYLQDDATGELTAEHRGLMRCLLERKESPL